MGLDINKIINEAIEETLETANENDSVFEEVSSRTKKIAAGSVVGAGALGAAGAGTEAGREMSIKAAGAIRTGAGKAYDATKDAAEKAYDATKDAAAKAYDATKRLVTKDPGEPLSKTIADAKEQHDGTGPTLANAANANELARAAKMASQDGTTDNAKELARAAKMAAQDGGGAVKSFVNDGSVGPTISNAAKLAKKALTQESAIASSISAGIGAKTIVEQMRKFK